MLEIVKGEKPVREKAAFVLLLERLAEEAFKDPGEWYSVEIPKEVTANSVASNIRRVVSKTAVEYTVAGGHAGIRFRSNGSDET